MLCPNCFSGQFNGERCMRCGYLMPEDENGTDMRLFFRLKNRYIVGRSIGAGGFGITYSAYDLQNDCRVAIKEYFPSGIVSRNSDGISIYYTRQNRIPEFKHGLARFKDEAEVIRKLNHISTVVNIIDTFEENGTAYYVMEYIDGISLKNLVPEGGLNLQLANEILKHIGYTVDLMHKEYGYLHRDISPENIMISTDKRCVLIDFGSAKNYYFENSEYTVTLKHGFAPIEQYSSVDVQGPYTDLYALAGTYYYTLTKTVIPKAPDRLMGAEYAPLHEIRPDVPLRVSEAVDRALMIRKSERTKTVSQFLDEVEAGMHEEEISKEHYVGVMIDGKEVREIKLEDDAETIVGKSAIHSDIVFEGCPPVSRAHCMIMFDSQKRKFCIEDMSVNGTYVNYQKIAPGQRYYVGSNDIINLANVKYRLVLKERVNT